MGEKVVYETVYENQRGHSSANKQSSGSTSSSRPLDGQVRRTNKFSARSLLPTDYPAWSDDLGRFKQKKELIECPSPCWEWISDWICDMSGNVDQDGWMYAFQFHSDGNGTGPSSWSGSPSSTSYVRRRKWIRMRRLNEQPTATLLPTPQPQAAPTSTKKSTLDAVIPSHADIVSWIEQGRLDREKLFLVKKYSLQMQQHLEQQQGSMDSRTDVRPVPAPPIMTFDKALLILKLFEFEASKQSALSFLMPFLDTTDKSSLCILINTLSFYSDRKLFALEMK